MKIFDLQQAREILPLIKAIVSEVVDKRSELYLLEERLEEEQDPLEKLYIESQIRELDQDIRRGLQKIEALGGVIKGLDPILVDFLSFHENRYIWLCWKEDEEDINYWHELNEGFAGRKPVEILELKNPENP
ncbi:DUF2203 domain-containing protein [Thermocrinis minervae]|uniref:DUF2203 domain-containing protein n=1 Tax=Thermocrinis minervae TaxID=381751 RepID=A0A1M6QL87_9AQUI|nr:DUF2203 domain-containing protein [Thermocrinis minervae]SHK20813.1 hypothetical protein SAMN05444391_0279 [Thermocrinis minervae]